MESRRIEAGSWTIVDTDTHPEGRPVTEYDVAPLGRVQLYWIPLGAGAHVVRLSGKIFEALSAGRQRRSPCALYHSALAVTVSEGRFVIEMTPVVDAGGKARGVVAEGAVGAGWAGHLRVFRYEIRCWRGGIIPDESHAQSMVHVHADQAGARHLVELVSSVPTPVWGRDELNAGEMLNSNSVTSWLLSRGGVDMATIGLPAGGRALDWDTGLVVAARP